MKSSEKRSGHSECFPRCYLGNMNKIGYRLNKIGQLDFHGQRHHPKRAGSARGGKRPAVLSEVQEPQERGRVDKKPWFVAHRRFWNKIGQKSE